ncbi:MAG TPA: hypothetical protein VL053_14825 [Arachidicoccus sp.]|nr:hypothetical protein [Arachidicoccus sp.]
MSSIKTISRGKINSHYFTVALCALTVFLAFKTVSAKATGNGSGNGTIVTPVAANKITIYYQSDPSGRIQFGAERVASALRNSGGWVQLQKMSEKGEIEQKTQSGVGARTGSDVKPGTSETVYIGTAASKFIQKAAVSSRINLDLNTNSEGFTLQSAHDNVIIVSGSDLSGALYGSLTLADRVQQLPATKSGAGLIRRLAIKDIKDQPQMKLRGACIGLQKPYLLPGRGTYEYPYTPENFPWFYNKSLWIKYLDMLVDNKMNTLYLWNGHPFASLVRLKDYPDAVEVDSATFRKNQEMFRFLTTEADKRGIWVIQAFYNIIVSKPFAEKHHIKTQDRNRGITPLIADYTRKSIAAFVENYPNVGLLVTLGEAMEGVGPDDTKWFTETIIPGVKDGLKALGKTKEPPIILRAHDSNAPDVMKASKPLYSNLYTMAKYNGEALTTYQPRGPWAELHRELSAVAPVQVENVHILANLEPFRYGADDFIQKCVQAMHQIYGSNGLHLYPQAGYWDWPYSADKTDNRLLQIDRDWIWYATWARYAWNCDRDRPGEVAYWSRRIAERYGCDQKTGADILAAYEQSGEIAPKLLRRYGITDGNRQTLSLGMLMSQLIHPTKYGLFTLLYNSEAPPGEMITEYAQKDWLKQPHSGETPVAVAREVLVHGQKAVDAIRAAAPGIHQSKAEFGRLENDMFCYQLLARFYSQKVRAALSVLRYGYSHDLTDLKKALPLLDSSVQTFRALADRTKDSYLYANSLQTGARKIPLSGKGGKYKSWTDLLPVYEQELDNFKKNIASLTTHAASGAPADGKGSHLKKLQPLGKGKLTWLEMGTNPQAADLDISIYSPNKRQTFLLTKGARPFSDTAVALDSVAGMLTSLQGIQVDKSKQILHGTYLHFKTTEPVKLWVGYFTGTDKSYLKSPELETDASANDNGQAATVVANALVLPGFSGVNIHSFTFGKGTHELQLPKGACLLLGFTPASETVIPFDAGLGTGDMQPDLDWLFQ